MTLYVPTFCEKSLFHAVVCTFYAKFCDKEYPKWISISYDVFWNNLCLIPRLEGFGNIKNRSCFIICCSMKLKLIWDPVFTSFHQVIISIMEIIILGLDARIVYMTYFWKNIVVNLYLTKLRYPSNFVKILRQYRRALIQLKIKIKFIFQLWKGVYYM